jgi:hypothetical protein
MFIVGCGSLMRKIGGIEERLRRGFGIQEDGL